jgi:hypothetical protein
MAKSDLPPTPNHLKLFTKEDLDGFAAEAKKMRADLGSMESVISERVLVHAQMLDKLTEKLIAQAQDAKTLEDALSSAALGLKAHSEYRALIAPLAARLGQRMKQQRELEGGDRVGKALLAGSAGVPGDGDSRRVRRRTGQSGPEDDGRPAGGPGEVVEGSVVVPDREGS